MPRAPPTHESHRSMVCVFLHNGVLGKGKSTTPVKTGDITFQRIIAYTALKSYDPDDPKYPCGLCTQHRNQLLQIAQVDKEPEEKLSKEKNLFTFCK